jgi:hypothetical protein
MKIVFRDKKTGEIAYEHEIPEVPDDAFEKASADLLLSGVAWIKRPQPRQQQHPLLEEIAEYRRERRLSMLSSLVIIAILSLGLWAAIWCAAAAINA